MKADLFGNRRKKYIEFIAYDWRYKRIATISTDPAATTNYFEANKNSLPFEVTPAFFRPEVLLKYKTDRDKYTIDSRQIYCRGAWSLSSYDVNEAGQVHSYICYLRDLPYEEQLYWASYNEPPKSPISDRAFTTDFKGEVFHQSDPLQAVTSIAQRWVKKGAVWWKMRDSALLERVTIPRTTSRDEWADAFMDLSKLIIEGFETKVIRSRLSDMGVAFEQNDQSLVLLERLVSHNAEISPNTRLIGLRVVQQIRSKVKGHSVGSEAVQLVQDALKQHGTFAAHFEHVCRLVGEELEQIEQIFPSQ